MEKTHRGNKKIYLFDIESNGLYESITQVWCMWIFDVETGERWGFRPHEIANGIIKLKEADIVVGHNIIDFDLPALMKMYPALRETSFEVVDTLCLSRFLQPDRNFESPAGHSLKSWGIRLGDEKGAYGDDTENAWDQFSESMYEYCEQDVQVNLVLYQHLSSVAGFDPLDPPTFDFHWEDRLTPDPESLLYQD